AAISMQLVENDEFEALSILDHALIERVLPCHQELEHHKICEEDIGLGLPDALTFVLTFLPGVPCEGRSQVFWQTRLVEELVELFPLAVGERVHRVDHDGPRAPLFAGGTRADRRVDDRYEEAEGLSRTGAGRDREALPRGGFRDRLHLMPVKRDRSSADSEDACHIRMERATCDERLDRGTVPRSARHTPRRPPLCSKNRPLPISLTGKKLTKAANAT